MPDYLTTQAGSPAPDSRLPVAVVGMLDAGRLLWEAVVGVPDRPETGEPHLIRASASMTGVALELRRADAAIDGDAIAEWAGDGMMLTVDVNEPGRRRLYCMGDTVDQIVARVSEVAVAPPQPPGPGVDL